MLNFLLFAMIFSNRILSEAIDNLKVSWNLKCSHVIFLVRESRNKHLKNLSLVLSFYIL